MPLWSGNVRMFAEICTYGERDLPLRLKLPELECTVFQSIILRKLSTGMKPSFEISILQRFSELFV